MAESFDILHPGPWFGPKPEAAGPVRPVPDGEKGRLTALCEALKVGDFSVRPALESFIFACSDATLKRQAIRLYCFTARHGDVEFIGRVAQRFDHDEVVTIVVTAPDTLSPEIIPYLFALLEQYQDTPVERDILSSINMLFPFGYEGQDIGLPELADRFNGFAKALVPGQYYYGGAPVFAGVLTKTLIEAAANARHRGVKFPLTHVPTLLSVWSGERCPVYYGQPVDDLAFKDTMAYVGRIAALGWERGVKYFYGRPVA